MLSMKTRKILISVLISLLIISISTIGFCEDVTLSEFKDNRAGTAATDLQSRTKKSQE